MMEWLGGTISKEDVGAEDGGKGGKDRKRKRDDENDDEAMGALALRFKYALHLTECPEYDIDDSLKQTSRVLQQSCDTPT